jgi:PAS domain S-box-containing protein
MFGYQASEAIGQVIDLIIPPELRDQERQIIAKLRQGELIDHFETVRVAKDGRRIDVSLTISPIRDGSGRIIAASKVGRDITERKHAEALQRLLMDELNHRVKNTLAMVQALANQSLRHAKDPGDFVASFSGRVQALAKAHTLLSETKLQGVEMTDLVRDQVQLGASDDQRISCSGPRLTINAQLAVHMTMILHELATNARKYGALSVPQGHLSLRWEVRTNGGREFYLQWRESGGPRVNVSNARGFGTTLIEQTVRAHNGVASNRYEAEGIVCEIKMPFLESERPDIGPFAAAQRRAMATPILGSSEALSGLKGT